MEKATPPHTLIFGLSRRCSVTTWWVFRAPDPYNVLVDLPRYMKASFVCEHDLFQVIFIIIYATGHFPGKRLAFGSIIWFEFLQNLHLTGIKLQSFMQNPVYSGGW